MAKAPAPQDENPTLLAVNDFVNDMMTAAADPIFRGLGKSKTRLREALSSALSDLRSSILGDIARIFRRDEISTADIFDAVDRLVVASVQSHDNTLYGRNIKAQVRTFKSRVTTLFAALPVVAEPAPVPAAAAAQPPVPPVEADPVPAPEKPPVAASEHQYTWDDPEAREVFMPDVMNAIVADALRTLRDTLPRLNPPLVTESEHVRGTDLTLLSAFLASLHEWMERTSIRHLHGQKISFEQFKKRIGIELQAVVQKMRDVRGSREITEQPNMPHADILKITEACVERIRSRIAAMDEKTVLTHAVTTTVRSEWDAERLFLPETVNFLEERLVSDEHVPYVIQGEELRHLLSVRRRSHVAVLRPSDITNLTNMLNDDYHGNLVRKDGGKTVTTVMEQDVRTALRDAERREEEEKLRPHLPGVFRKVADLYATGLVAGLSAVIEAKHLAGHPQQTGSLSSGESVPLVNKQSWSQEWQNLAFSLARTGLEQRLPELESVPAAELLGSVRTILLQDLTTHSAILADFSTALARSFPEAAPDFLVQEGSLMLPDTAEIEAVLAAPEQYAAYTHDPATMKTVAVPLLRGRTTLAEFPLAKSELFSLQTMLRSHVAHRRFTGLTMEEIMTTIAEPDEVLAVLAKRFNEQYHGGLPFRTVDDLMVSAREYLVSQSLNVRKPEAEHPVIEEEFDWLLERNLWPTERELQRAMRRIASDVYGSTEPVKESKDPVPLIARRAALLERFHTVDHERHLARWVELTGTADEFDPGLREKLFTECFEIEDWMEKLAAAGEPLTQVQLDQLQERVRRIAYNGAQNSWHIADFEAFTRRTYRQETERTHPEKLAGLAHPAVTAPSTYHATSFNWLSERRIIEEATAPLREAESWPTEREVQAILHRVTTTLYPEGGLSSSVFLGLRASIVEAFDPALAAEDLAQLHPAVAPNIQLPQEVLGVTLQRGVREREIVSTHVPEVARTIVQRMLSVEPDVFFARHAVITLLANDPEPSMPDILGIVSSELYGNRDIWHLEDFVEYVTRQLTTEIMAIWPAAREEAQRAPLAPPADAPPEEAPIPSSADPVTDNLVFEASASVPQPSTPAAAEESMQTLADPHDDALQQTSYQTTVDSRGEAEHVHTDQFFAQETATDPSAAVRVSLVHPMSSDQLQESLPVAPASSPEQAPESAVRLQSLMRDAYQKAYDGVPSMDTLVELETQMDAAEDTIRGMITALPTQARLLDADHPAFLAACHGEAGMDLEDFFQNDYGLIRSFLAKLTAYQTAVLAADQSREAWPAFNTTLRQHRSAVLTFNNHRNAAARVTGVSPEDVTELLGLGHGANGIEEVLQKIDELTERHDRLGELTDQGADDEFLDAARRLALEQKGSGRIEAMTKKLANLNRLVSGPSLPSEATYTPPSAPSVAAPALAADTAEEGGLTQVPATHQSLVHSLLLYAAGGEEAGNKGVGISYSRYRPSCEALGLNGAADISFNNPDDAGFQMLLQYSTVTLEAKKAIDVWSGGVKDRKHAQFPGGKTTIPTALQGADTLFICALNSAKYWTFTATNKGRQYAEQFGIALTQTQVENLAAAKEKRMF